MHYHMLCLLLESMQEAQHKIPIGIENYLYSKEDCIEEMPTNASDDGGGVKLGNTWHKNDKQPPHMCI